MCGRARLVENPDTPDTQDYVAGICVALIEVMEITPLPPRSGLPVVRVVLVTRIAFAVITAIGGELVESASLRGSVRAVVGVTTAFSFDDPVPEGFFTMWCVSVVY